VESGAPEIVAVDDDAFSLRMIETLLRSDGHTRAHLCRTVAAALDALDALLGRKILLICDLNMPETDGVEFIRILATRRFEGELIICSGANRIVRNGAVNLAQAYGLRLCGIVEKPISPQLFIRQIRASTQPEPVYLVQTPLTGLPKVPTPSC
jgi:CheY-like chemotaxis protein